MNLYKTEKAELIKSGKFNDYRIMKKEAFSMGMELSPDPNDLGFTEFEFDLIKRLEKQTKRKKSNFRKHAFFIGEYYDNIGFLTLSFKDKALDLLSFETIKKRMAQCCKECFDDYIGMLEISPGGRLHGHFIVGWYGSVLTRDIFRDGHINKLVVNKHDLTDFWFGTKDENDQPTKYGIYDLILMSKEDRTERNKATNYSMKSLNSMESYITKNEPFDFDDQVSDELIFKVNTSSVIVARNTPFQLFNKLQKEQDRNIKSTCRAFDTTFYDDNKFNSKSIFRTWAELNKETNISLHPGEHQDMLGNDFFILTIDKFKELYGVLFLSSSVTYNSNKGTFIPKSDPLINIVGVTLQEEQNNRTNLKDKERTFYDETNKIPII